MNQPDLVILDATAIDGTLAAWALRQRWPSVPIYGHLPEDPEELAPLGILIIGGEVAEEPLRALSGACRWLYVCANTGEEALKALRDEGALHYKFDARKSACTAAWEYAMGEGRRAPELLQHAQDHALGIYEMPDTIQIIAAVTSYGWDDLSPLVRRVEDPAKRPVLVAEGAAIMRHINKTRAANV